MFTNDDEFSVDPVDIARALAESVGDNEISTVFDVCVKGKRFIVSVKPKGTAVEQCTA